MFGLRNEAWLELICECGDGTCTTRVKIARRAYDELRAAPGRRHLVVSGHEREDMIVARGDGYVVVAD
jgi:hypothetical protein